ncbi:7-carboxy-7-deazaguanine synthase QueE [Fibrobacterota bacterium]
MRKIAINEIFYSIQGEGFYTGKPAVFIRTAGCNLSCSYCDTDFSEKERLSCDSILERVREFPVKMVVLTGGEPTLQAEILAKLVRQLQQKKYYVTLETNGTSLDTLDADWVTVSPKLSQGGKWVLRRGQEIKVLCEGQDLSVYEDSEFSHYFLQPVEIRTRKWGAGERDIKKTREQMKKTIEAVKEKPKWRLSIQIHKELGIN